MTDDMEQQQLIDMIERLIAGETVEAAGVREEEMEKLLAIAAELSERRPQPSAVFEQDLDRKIAELQTPAGASSRWFHGWLSMPRLAAVAAALVIGLGVVGMGTAIIRGGYQGGTATVSEVSSDSSNTGNDIKSLENTTGQNGAARPGEATDGNTAVSPEAGAADMGTAAGLGGAPLPSTQRIMQTADYQIEVARGEFDDKYDQITAIASKYGGYVVSGDTRSSGDALKRGSISIRVASANDSFTKAQADLEGLGNVTSRKISGQDVTEEYVDLQSRLRNAEAQETQMLELMKKAQTIDEILTVQSRLADIQSQIEQIKGRMTYMESRTDFATITIDLREAGETTTETGGGTDWGFVDSLKYAGWLAVQTVNFVIVALAVIIPLALMGGVLIYVIYRLVHRRRNRGITNS